MLNDKKDKSTFLHCPLCQGRQVNMLLKDGSKDYYACHNCHIRFLSSQRYLTRQEEFTHYQTHENTTDDPGYRTFLAKLVVPLLERLTEGSRGLDYGCGPGPALAEMMKEEGHHISLYDPFYAPDKKVLTQKYDFITCTETAEHFHYPDVEFNKLAALLKPRGWLAVMTCFQTDDEKFDTWHYRHDPTHVVFYKKETFIWLARRLGLSCDIPRKDVVLMQKIDAL